MLEEVLGDRTRILGEDHVDTLLSRAQLGAAYGSTTERLDEGVPLLERTLADLERTLGTDHPHVLDAFHPTDLPDGRLPRLPGR